VRSAMPASRLQTRKSAWRPAWGRQARSENRPGASACAALPGGHANGAWDTGCQPACGRCVSSADTRQRSLRRMGCAQRWETWRPALSSLREGRIAEEGRTRRARACRHGPLWARRPSPGFLCPSVRRRRAPLSTNMGTRGTAAPPTPPPFRQTHQRGETERRQYRRGAWCGAPPGTMGPPGCRTRP